MRRPALLACAVSLALAPAAVALVTDGTTPTAFTAPLALNGADGTTTGGAEPSIEVDSHGQVYVSAPVGIPTGGCPFWEVDPETRTAAYRGTIDVDNFGVGGGDCDISLTDNPTPGATHDVASVTSLSLANLTSNTTSDGGQTWMPVANPASQQVFGVDRQWQVADRGLDRHYLTVHDLETQNIQVAVATDGGYQYVSNVPAIDPTTTSQALSTGVSIRGISGSNSFGTTVVDPQTHKLYIPFVAPAGSTFEQNGVYVAEGDPCALAPCEKGLPAGPISWTNHLAYAGPLTAGLGDGFPAIALDKGGVLHLAWTGDSGKPASAGAGQDSNRVFTIHSQPRDVAAGSWSAPQAVDAGTGNANAFPWLVAGDAGKVGIAWYSSTLAAACVGPAGPTGDVNDSCRNVWSVTYASSQDANGAAPTWELTDVSGVVHRGAICAGGLSCPAGTRTLLDFFDVALDAQGRANLVYNSDVRAPGVADIFYTRQCTGTSLTGVALSGPCGTGGDPTPTTAPGTACPGGRAGFVDKAGDANELVVTGETPLPSDPAVDIVDGSVSWDEASATAVFRMTVTDLAANPTVGDAYFRWQALFDGDTTPYWITGTKPADGSAPTFQLWSNATGATVTTQALTGSFDPATGTMEIRVPSDKYVAAQSGNKALTGTRVVSIATAVGQRSVIAATLSTDTADTTCAGPLAAPVVATPTPTATVDPTPTPTATVDPTPTPTVDPTPTCTPNGGGGGGSGQGGGGSGGGGSTKCPKK